MSFKDIKGQERAIKILQGYIEQSRLSGGYLFVGPEGVGKKLAARELAKMVNCLEGGIDPSTALRVNGERSRAIEACEGCASCNKIENNQHPDVHIIAEGSGDIKIELIRQLQKTINLRPYEGKTKVFIIDNAHRLTAEASNAMLKILEEPPKNSLIILISDKPNLLFKTIISRCKILRFSAFVRKKLEELLKKDYDLSNNAAHFLAYFSEGRLGCALRLKERDFLKEKNRVIDEFVFSRTSGLEGVPLQKKDTVRQSLNILAAWFRDIYLIKIGMPHREVINFDRKDDLLRKMNDFSCLDLNEILYSISDSISYLDQNINTKLLLYNLEAQLWKR